jgi:hypothetical protein
MSEPVIAVTQINALDAAPAHEPSGPTRQNEAYEISRLDDSLDDRELLDTFSRGCPHSLTLCNRTGGSQIAQGVCTAVRAGAGNRT